jgi:hypothetical protein
MASDRPAGHDRRRRQIAGELSSLQKAQAEWLKKIRSPDISESALEPNP